MLNDTFQRAKSVCSHMKNAGIKEGWSLQSAMADILQDRTCLSFFDAYSICDDYIQQIEYTQSLVAEMKEEARRNHSQG